MPKNQGRAVQQAAQEALTAQVHEETPIEIMPDGRIQRLGQNVLPDAGNKIRVIDEKGEFAQG
ncbi:MAG: hypothetical protein B193_1986 [Solidesulfovibrio magneticus str. Maddingley MBC34]|uniref:Uncharacterized protein n=1 Tax=Solidesulfovibrio magneticus str. Maddingley MBC34 TaxID=1206767 RepID=K6GDZ0_9BACT|nr:MAG: hypothetical protein B193_1986 [Solidesulfovibrio magneticus str. Maddingley MBC34]